jgi:predicted transcriptional regulator
MFTEIEILILLTKHPMTRTEIANALSMSIISIGKSLTVLETMGLIYIVKIHRPRGSSIRKYGIVNNNLGEIQKILTSDKNHLFFEELIIDQLERHEMSVLELCEKFNLKPSEILDIISEIEKQSEIKIKKNQGINHTYYSIELKSDREQSEKNLRKERMNKMILEFMERLVQTPKEVK